MQVLKRVEIWVLLALVGSGLVWVFTTGSGPDDEAAEPGAAAGTGAGEQSSTAPLVLHRALLERDYGNGRLELEVRVRNDSPSKLTLQPPQVKLVSGSGREVQPFFLPFEPQPEVAASATQDVQLRYWLDKKDLEGSLTLTVGGASIEVKGARPFDLETLKTKEQKVFRAGEW